MASNEDRDGGHFSLIVNNAGDKDGDILEDNCPCPRGISQICPPGRPRGIGDSFKKFCKFCLSPRSV